MQGGCEGTGHVRCLAREVSVEDDVDRPRARLPPRTHLTAVPGTGHVSPPPGDASEIAGYTRTVIPATRISSWAWRSERGGSLRAA